MIHFQVISNHKVPIGDLACEEYLDIINKKLFICLRILNSDVSIFSVTIIISATLIL